MKALRSWWPTAGLLVVLALDRVLKWLSVTRWSGEPLSLLPFVELRFLLNRGIAFSLPVHETIVLIASAFALIALCIWAIFAIHKKRTGVVLGLAAIVVGAASNIADRLIYGGVIDYLRIGFLPIVNCADLLILFGVCRLLLSTKQHAHPILTG